MGAGVRGHADAAVQDLLVADLSVPQEVPGLLLLLLVRRDGRRAPLVDAPRVRASVQQQVRKMCDILPTASVA